MTRDWQERFDETFESWAKRAPQTPPRAAAARVLEQAEGRRQLPVFASAPSRLVAAAAGLILVSAAAWIVLRPAPVPVEELAVPPLEDNVVLLWLDRETPLYLTVAPPAAKGDS